MSKRRKYPKFSSIRRRFRKGLTLRCWVTDPSGEHGTIEVLLNPTTCWLVVYEDNKMHVDSITVSSEEVTPQHVTEMLRSADRWEWLKEEELWKFSL